MNIEDLPLALVEEALRQVLRGYDFTVGDMTFNASSLDELLAARDRLVKEQEETSLPWWSPTLWGKLLKPVIVLNPLAVMLRAILPKKLAPFTRKEEDENELVG